MHKPPMHWMCLALLFCHGPSCRADTSTSPAPAPRELVSMGQAVFKERCVVCHGVNADGHSKLAQIMKPPPANLRISRLSALQREDIVRRGGQAVGRSNNMPTWEAELSAEQIHAVVAYVGTLQADMRPPSIKGPP